jgi:hypothetical protein
MSEQDTITEQERCLDRIRVLNRSVWEDRVNQRMIDLWLANFTGQVGSIHLEHLHALHLLSNFMFFGQREIRELLKVMYRDHIRYPLLQGIRNAAVRTASIEELKRSYDKKLLNCRFLGVGNPSDSGSFLLYYFRQENKLSRKLFVNTHAILDDAFEPDADLFVFIDDFCGSGDTAKRYSSELVSRLKERRPNAKAAYCVLFGFQEALTTIREQTEFDSVDAAIELDENFKCFAEGSRYFAGAPDSISRDFAEAMALHYGKCIEPGYPLGYKDGQLLLGFAHNTPNNSLPILWADEDRQWHPIFPRYRKQYGWNPSSKS